MQIFCNFPLLLALPSLFFSSSLANDMFPPGGRIQERFSDYLIKQSEPFTVQDVHNNDNHYHHHSYLRRHLPYDDNWWPFCQANEPAGVLGDCDSRPAYACTCRGSLANRTMCSFCSGMESVCQQVGTSTTFYDQYTGIFTPCTCDYDAITGAIKQDCQVQEPANPPPYTPGAPLPPWNGPEVCRTNNPVAASQIQNCFGTYDCTCTGNLASQTICSYCTLMTSQGRVCQTTASSSTFNNPGIGVTTCSCDYDANTGLIQQSCHVGTPPAPPTPSPIGDDRADAPGGGGVSPNVPLPPLPTISCQASSTSKNIFVCLDATMPYPGYTCDVAVPSCDFIEDHPCSCAGSAQTSCSYCRVRTADAVVCQLTGNTMKFLAPDGATKSCTCMATANGGSQQVCNTTSTPTPQASGALVGSLGTGLP